MKDNLNDYTVPEIVKMMREWTGTTQESFARRVGYSTSQIQNIEQQRSNLYFHIFLDWCDKNGITLAMEKK